MQEYIEILKVYHNGNQHIGCITSYGSKAANVIRQMPGRRWSQSLRLWYLPYNKTTWYALKNALKNENIEIIVRKDNSEQKNENKIIKDKPTVKKRIKKSIDNKDTSLKLNYKAFEEYKQMLALKKYSQATTHIYLSYYLEFLKYFEDRFKEVEDLLYHDISDYVIQKTHNLGLTQKKQVIASIKFYYEKCVGRQKMFFYINTADYKIMPILFSWQECNNIANAKIKNPTHKIIFYLVFYLGLKAENIAKLDINNPEKTLKKYTNYNWKHIQEKFYILIKNHKAKYKNKKYLFEIDAKKIEKNKMRQYIWHVCIENKLVEVFEKEFENIITQTNFEHNTIRQYRSMFKLFVNNVNLKVFLTSDPKYLKAFLQQYSEDKVSDSQNAMVNVIKFYFKHCRNKEFLSKELPRAKKDNYKPNILTISQIFDIIGSYSNIKHKTLIALIYSAGLRRSEAQKLKLKDINFIRGTIFIKAAKGKKDRYTLLSKKLKPLLKSYIENINLRNICFMAHR